LDQRLAACARFFLDRARVDRLDMNFDARGFTYERFERFLPGALDNEYRLTAFNRWVSEPLFVPDLELLRTLRFEISTLGSPALEMVTACYFRSWMMTCQQLRKIIHCLEEKVFDTSKLPIGRSLFRNRSQMQWWHFDMLAKL